MLMLGRKSESEGSKSNLFDEAEFRIQRAGEHLIELEIELLRFERVEFVEILTGLPKDDPRNEEETAKLMEWVGVVDINVPSFVSDAPPPVPSRVRILVGEVAYNLAAALDYVIFVLARLDSGAEKNGTQFPVCRSKEIFGSGRNAMLKGLSDEHVALIEQLQPYNGCTWTGQLKGLSNLDKHRQLIRAQATVLRVYGSDANAKGETSREARARRRAKLPKPVLKMYYGKSRIVTFDDGTPIIKTLEILRSQVADLLVQFKSLIDQPMA
jgi:hypothetical protein